MGTLFTLRPHPRTPENRGGQGEGDERGAVKSTSGEGQLKGREIEERTEKHRNGRTSERESVREGRE